MPPPEPLSRKFTPFKFQTTHSGVGDPEKRGLTMGERMQLTSAEVSQNVYTNVAEVWHMFTSGVKNEQVQPIMEGLQKKRLYSYESGRFTRLPSHPEYEAHLYAPFIRIANVVSRLSDTRQDGMTLRWRNTYNKVPDSYWSTTPKMRPDIVVELVPEHEPLCKPSWNRVILVGEFKRALDPTQPIVQLACYVRQIFMEQPDRRFVLGFTLTGCLLTTWYFDRSGILGSVPINVHEKANSFVRFLIGCSQMSDERFGFDPTFLWFQKIEKKIEEKIEKKIDICLPSYRIPPSVVRNGFADLHWIFSMPKKEGKGVQRFVTFRAHTFQPAEVITGKATAAWLVYTYEDFLTYRDPRVSSETKAKLKVYFFKSAWRVKHRISESQIYTKIGRLDGVAKLYSTADVWIKGKHDTTRRNRMNIKTEGNPLTLVRERKPPDFLKPRASSRTGSQRPSRADVYADYGRKDTDIPLDELVQYLKGVEARARKSHLEIGRFRTRAHSRIVLETFGAPLTDFISKEELLTVLIDVVNGHKHLADQGYLHRDLTRGNIIITNEPSPNHGIIVDLDHSIPLDPNYDGEIEDHHTGTCAFMSNELLCNQSIFSRAVVTDNNNVMVPKVIHDMESIFWIMCWMFTMREGPSTRRRTGDGHSDGNAATVQANAWHSAGPAQTASNKRVAIRYQDEFLLNIGSHLAPYFRHMLTLLDNLREILLAAYQHNAYDSLHDDFVKELQTRLDKLRGEDDPLEDPQGAVFSGGGELFGNDREKFMIQRKADFDRMSQFATKKRTMHVFCEDTKDKGGAPGKSGKGDEGAFRGDFLDVPELDEEQQDDETDEEHEDGSDGEWTDCDSEEDEDWDEEDEDEDWDEEDEDEDWDEEDGDGDGEDGDRDEDEGEVEEGDSLYTEEDSRITRPPKRVKLE